MPLVSIVVASYNHARFVTASIESLVNQTLRDFELIVIDDGSKDESPAILADLAARYRFKLVCRENRGLARTLNQALDELVTGTYVVFFASDDVCEPDRLARQAPFLEANPELAMCWGDAWKIDENGARIGRMISSPGRGQLFGPALRGELHVPGQTTMWRRSALDAVGRFDPAVRSEDIWLLWSVSRRFPIAQLPGVYASYREHGTQTSRDARLMVAQAQKILACFADAPEYEDARRRQALYWFFALSEAHKREALAHLRDAARQPLSPLFVGGLLTLAGLGGLRRPYAAIRDRLRG